MRSATIKTLEEKTDQEALSKQEKEISLLFKWGEEFGLSDRNAYLLYLKKLRIFNPVEVEIFIKNPTKK